MYKVWFALNIRRLFFVEMQDFQKIATSFVEILDKVATEVDKEKMKVCLNLAYVDEHSMCCGTSSNFCFLALRTCTVHWMSLKCFVQ